MKPRIGLGIAAIGIVAGICGGMSGSPAVAATAPSVQSVHMLAGKPSGPFIPEWYQYCSKTRPIGVTAGRSGYMNAFSSATGVTCQWWVVSWGAGFPHTVKKSYSWDTVCRYYGGRYTSWKNDLPWCS